MNGLANLQVGEVVSAGMQDIIGAADVSAQRALCYELGPGKGAAGVDHR